MTHVLLASGRVPNVEALNLERIGVERHKAGIVVDEHLRTSVDGIWAAGDVTGLAQLTPIAQYQARLAVDDMFTDDARGADYSVLPTSIFTDPEVAGVGLTEQQARAEGLEFETVRERRRPARAVHRGEAHPLQAHLRAGVATRPRHPRRGAERGRHRPGLLAGDEARRDRRRHRRRCTTSIRRSARASKRRPRKPGRSRSRPNPPGPGTVPGTCLERSGVPRRGLSAGLAGDAFWAAHPWGEGGCRPSLMSIVLRSSPR